MKQFMILCFITLLVSCSGASLIEPDSTESVEASFVTVMAMAVHHSTPIDGEYPDYLLGDGTKQFANDLGVLITLRKALVRWGSIELISGGDDSSCEDGHDQTLSASFIEDLFDADLESVQMAMNSSVEVRSYCRYALNFLADTNTSTENESFAELDGASVYVEGSWSFGGGQGDFAITVAEDFSSSGNFRAKENGENIDHPLHFTDNETQSMITFGNRYDQWFDGIDFTESDDALADEVKDNIQDTVHQHLGDHSHS